MPNKLRDRFNRMMEQAKKWDSAALSEARKNHRYLNLISFIEEKIQPFTDNDEGFKGDVFKGLGYLHDMTDNPGKASGNFREAKKIFLRIKDRKGLAETCVLIGDMHRDYGHSRQALQNYQKAIQLSENNPELSNFEAESLYGIGDLCRTRGNYPKALAHLRKAKAIYKKNKNIPEISEILWIEGYTYICMGQYGKAERTFNQMIQWYDQGLTDEKHRNTATGALGDVYRLTGRCEESLKLYAEAEESMDIEGNSSGRAWILAVMGHSYLQEGKIAEAKRQILRAENLSRKKNNDINLVWALQAKAELERLEGRKNDARKTYRESQRVAKKYGLRLETAHSHLGLAELAKQTGPQASGLYGKALKIYKEIGSKWGIRECQKRMGFFRKTMEHQTVPINFP